MTKAMKVRRDGRSDTTASDDEKVIEVTSTPIMKIVTAEQLAAQEKLDRVKAIYQQAEQLWWEYSGLLYEIWSGTLYMVQGFESWAEYVEQELDISQSLADKSVRAYKWIAGFDPGFQAWVHALGPSKARLLTGKFGPDDAAVWRGRLEGMTYRQMEAVLRGSDPDQLTAGAAAEPHAAVAGADYGADGYEDGLAPHLTEVAATDAADGSDPAPTAEILYADEERPEVVHFALYPEQRRNVEMALERARKVAQSDKNGNVLDLICTAYLMQEGVFESKAECLAALERTLGVRIAAFDRTMRVVYGVETLSLIADIES